MSITVMKLIVKVLLERLKIARKGLKRQHVRTDQWYKKLQPLIAEAGRKIRKSGGGKVEVKLGPLAPE